VNMMRRGPKAAAFSKAAGAIAQFITERRN
jgi:hypothetical protein